MMGLNEEHCMKSIFGKNSLNFFLALIHVRTDVSGIAQGFLKLYAVKSHSQLLHLVQLRSNRVCDDEVCSSRVRCSCICSRCV